MSYNLLFSASDDGVTWTAPVAFALTGSIPASERILAAGGKVVVLTGGPNVFRSADLVTFTQDTLNLVEHSMSVSGAFGADGKLWVGFEGTTPAQADATGASFSSASSGLRDSRIFAVSIPLSSREDCGKMRALEKADSRRRRSY